MTNQKANLTMIVNDIIVKGQYKIKEKNEKLVALSVSFADYNVIFIKETNQNDLNEFKYHLINNLQKKVKTLNDYDGFVVGDWHIERADDYQRIYTNDEQSKINHYGYDIIPTLNKVLVFTNNVTGKEFVLRTKLRGKKN